MTLISLAGALPFFFFFYFFFFFFSFFSSAAGERCAGGTWGSLLRQQEVGRDGDAHSASWLFCAGLFHDAELWPRACVSIALSVA